MATGWKYIVATSPGGYRTLRSGGLFNAVEYANLKEALLEWKRRSRLFRRSKEVDYEFPWADTSDEVGETA
jgi:hypothetical protein